MYSSSGDITRFGRAILKSTIIPKAMTNRFLKPVSFTSDPNAGMGIAWGIRKIQVGNHPYRWTYGYQKAGRIGDYASLMILLPDYDIGFTVLMAGDIPANFNFDCADYMGVALLPIFEAAAKAESNSIYAGRYVGSDPAANTSMVIVTDDRPGLGVASWYNNGTDMNVVSTMIQLQSWTPITPTVRLYPSGLETVRPDGSKTVAWRAIFEDANGIERAGRMFSTDCATWLSMTSYVYGSRAIDQVLFHFDPKGKVVAIEPGALRAKYEKVNPPTPRRVRL
jgi:hypothetical protein